jgi:hypothetical protein
MLALRYKNSAVKFFRSFYRASWFMEISFAGIIFTGPINPDCCSGESFFHNRQLVNV